MASVASILPRNMLRSVQRISSASSSAQRLLLQRPLSSSRALRAGVYATNPPPMEPHKQRDPQQAKELGVGELEGTEFRVEPVRRVDEDDGTMRARLVYQSRKRGTLESDLLLSTFADAYLPTMTREQMTQYDQFLDENDWDIYYWATQEPPSNAISSSSPASPTSVPTPSIATEDTSSASYAGGAEAILSESTPLSDSTSTTANTSASAEAVSTGGLPPAGDAGEGKEAAAAAEEPYRTQGETFSGEWAQTVGTFKPAYRPVPARWRDSEVLQLLREHVKTRAKEKGGMAFMPALRDR
ncbi:DUF339-domain-containing protein [Hypoxylon trugodes]|uniref:DUF339-domain-containing protein n=1 Tax=Hypoxylon trugodes TaxID=326681 RepID=UPI002191CC96|nr:DUF339-domain-containing protein [Hypoxylon trugodes]KAI1389429.1 DUF339-domain-containing protein [Hypoxylon trugodes]